MTDTNTRMDRRTVLKATGTAVVGLSSAGCLESLPGTSSGPSEDVVLDSPERYEQRADKDLPYPIYAETLPEATVPAPMQDREVTTTEFVGDRHSMLTFIFTRCSMACPALTASLVRVQQEAINEGYADEFAFMPTTFDVEYDTPEKLREFGQSRNADMDAGNWWFLRPESPERAREIVSEKFGVHYEYLESGERQMENMAWLHSNLILLVNKKGYVERSYTGQPPNPATVLEDAKQLHSRW